MQINTKGYREWTSKDLSVIIDNDVYKENEFIDYKENFAVLECSDKAQKKKKQDEFRHDVCSFANANGGYLIFGIKEDAGVPIDILGVAIDNIDRFELDRRNELFGIMPIVPVVDFSFIQLKNERYVVIIKISKGSHKPYIYVENEGVFKFFIRRGNRKQAMSYMEISSNFLHSSLLTDEIKKFRKDKMLMYREEQKGIPFALIQVIPDDFFSNHAGNVLYDIYKERKLNLHNIFDGLCFGHAVPNVEGICFPDYDYDNGVFVQIYNNGATELFYKVETREKQGEPWIWYPGIINQMESLLQGTARLYKEIGQRSTMYVCVSIFGCKGMWSEYDFGNDYAAKVDRNEIYCMPLEIGDILDESIVSDRMAECKKMICYSLGRRG